MCETTKAILKLCHVLQIGNAKTKKYSMINLTRPRLLANEIVAH